MSEQEAFAECFTLVDEAEAQRRGFGVAGGVPFCPDQCPLFPPDGRQRHRRPHAAHPHWPGRGALTFGHPIRVAEDVATLDHISQGRVELGRARYLPRHARWF